MSVNQVLFQSIEHLPGIGSRRFQLLQKLGLQRVMDALFFFPRSYEDHSQLKTIGETVHGETATVIGEVNDFEVANKGGRSTFYLLIKQGSDFLRAIWFNQPYRANNIDVGKRVLISGKIEIKGLSRQTVHPHMNLIEESDEPAKGSIFPVYRLTDGIKQAEMRRIIRSIVEEYADQVAEILPQELRTQQQLPEIQQSLFQIHVPKSPDDVDSARNRFVYQELLMLQLALLLRRKQVEASEQAIPLELSSQIDARIRSYFSFDLTNAQNRAIEEIKNDLQKPIPMNRMLHGDVGSGKTIIAIYGLMLAVANDAQGVLMAPTETLARQHYRHLQELLARTKVRVGLLTGASTAKERKELLSDIASGEVGIVIGTQALIQNDIEFHNLGIVIVDEQHRFGVKQRAQLRQKGIMPHYLVMTATPIPRTVSMTLFGDLDISRLDELPPDRIPIKTYLCSAEQQLKWWDFVRKKVNEGRQAFVIAPLVDEKEDAAWSSVEQTFESLVNGELSEFRVDLVHGRQSAEEKEAAMVRFAEGETQVLVATTVVEVGINVPNATMMTILSASRFGLSQLHQLRGRVGRGNQPGYVALFDDSDSEMTQERLQSFAETTDGFKIAELDFELRGPGDLFGTKQHGMPPLFVADLVRDYELLVKARHDANQLLEQDPQLEADDFAEIRQRILARYGESLELSDVG